MKKWRSCRGSEDRKCFDVWKRELDRGIGLAMGRQISKGRRAVRVIIRRSGSIGGQ